MKGRDAEEFDLMRQRLARFDGAAKYDSERNHPAGDEARQTWNAILDKPHYALPEIQTLITERDEALSLAKTSRVECEAATAELASLREENAYRRTHDGNHIEHDPDEGEVK